MCKSVWAVAAVVCMGLASWAVAQDSPKAQDPQGQEPSYLAAGFLARELKLTDSQKEQVEQIMRKARADAQQASEPQARQQIFHAAVEQIGQKVLTEEQREKFRQLRQRRTEPTTYAQGQEPPYLAAGFLARELKLTDAQKEQVEQIMRKARADAQQATEPQARRQIFQAATEQISKNVLTDEQRAKFARLRQQRTEQAQALQGAEPAYLAAGFLAKELKLTDAQKEQVEQIMRKARIDAQQATELQAKGQIFQGATEQISKNVLTEEQRANFASLRQQRKEQALAPEGQEPPFLAAGFLAKELKLTDAQKEQVEQIMRKARIDAQQAAELQAKGQIFQGATERISKDVLTEEQRAKFAQLRQQRME